ncbi:hypothetical protein C5167_008235 [Papaver somniferum]|uniref:Glucose-methanol-choline oxidoreductase N-terminal domain-containing protein n=1 Tax=Papaver somniferum TaxID=3469 RepID=A0A4Y7JTY4_PAPSO|nr:hypothetical protein C5167_008235 [Papaver somniferum]
MGLFVLWMLVASIANSGSFCLTGLSYPDDDQNDPNYVFLHEATSAPAISYYHYIVIGGGAAGCPLAATLSSKYNVLLIERGGSPYGNPNITNLSSFHNNTLADLSSTSLSQRFISEDGVINSRARVLGGGTSINAGFYSRAEPKYVKDSSWDDKLVNESYEWVEKFVVFKPKIEAWQSAVRDGLLEVGVLPNNGFTFDHVNGTKIGGTMFDQNGHRHTAADLLRYANPKRITVLLHATVGRVLFRSKGNQKPVAYGVMFTDASGMRHKAYLKQEGLGLMKNEIVLSAGALGSPQLLMLSGVGPADHLRSLNITVVVDQPLVGQGMSDNPMKGIFLKTKNPNANPLVTFNYFKEPRDLQRCVNGVKTIEKVVASKAFSKFRFDSISFQTLLNLTSSFPINLVPKTGNDSTSLEQFCRNTVTTIWHYHGGCQVGKVIDQDHKVLGVDSLKVYGNQDSEQEAITTGWDYGRMT